MRELYRRKNKRTGEFSDVWWCEFHDPRVGRTVRRTTKCRDREAARTARQRLEREAQHPNRKAPDKPALTVEMILESFINDGLIDVSPATRNFYEQKVGVLKHFIAGVLVDDLRDVSVVKAYIKERQKAVAPSTIYKELVALRQALHGARESGLIDFDPRMCFPRFRAKTRVVERWLTPLEFLQLLRAFSPWKEGDDPRYWRQGAPHRQLWITLAVLTGGNDSEVDGMQWPGVDWAQARIHLPGKKRDARDRWVPLLPALATVLEHSRRATGYIVGEWGNVRRDLHAACDRAGIPRCSPNDLRRTFCTWMANMGVAENALIAMMGHTSSRMIRRVYAKLQPILFAREMEKLTGRCPAGVPASRPIKTDLTVVSQESMREVFETLEKLVLEPRVELGTRGFSVRAPINKYEKLSRKNGQRTAGVRVVGSK